MGDTGGARGWQTLCHSQGRQAILFSEKCVRIFSVVWGEILDVFVQKTASLGFEISGCQAVPGNFHLCWATLFPKLVSHGAIFYLQQDMSFATTVVTL